MKMNAAEIHHHVAASIVSILSAVFAVFVLLAIGKHQGELSAKVLACFTSY